MACRVCHGGGCDEVELGTVGDALEAEAWLPHVLEGDWKAGEDADSEWKAKSTETC